MAVTKTLTKAVPYVKSSKVEKWDLEMKYENDSEGDATYYTGTFSTTVENVDPVSGATVFSKKAKGSWTAFVSIGIRAASATSCCPLSITLHILNPSTISG